MTRARQLVLARLAGLTALAACTSMPPEEMMGPATCERDMSANAMSAIALPLDMPSNGYVCPRGDEDWYAFDVAAPRNLARISVDIRATASAIQPSYALFERDAMGAAGRAIGTGVPVGNRLTVGGTHCVSSGSYFLSVRDQGNDAQDIRNAYTVRVTTAENPDRNEPNDSLMTARALVPGTPAMGAIACDGDNDYFSFTVPPMNVVRLQLTMAQARLEPMLALVDSMGVELTQQTNLSGSVGATDLSIVRVVPAGTWYARVKDNDDRGSDPDVNYTLSLELLPDSDDNEPNNHPREATPLASGTVACAAPMTFTMRGTIGSAGDVDFYGLALSGCAGGVIDATMTFDSPGDNAAAWALQRDVQASIGLVHAHAPSTCNLDSECTALTASCSDSWDCAGNFNTCLAEGRCAGATLCLPTNQCASNQVQRNYQALSVPASPTMPPPANTARFVAPLLGAGQIFLRVTDFQSNNGRPDARYTVTVTIRADPDSREPDNLYATTLANLEDLPAARSTPTAFTVPLHNCTTGDCCNSGNWITGYVSYEHDIDWFRYAHPCAGADCMVRLRYEVDPGPSNIVFAVFHGNQLWYDRSYMAGTSGALGGLAASDQCFYAYRSHEPNYHIAVRDNGSDGINYSSTQQYRFCVEKIANTCVAPCMDYGPTLGCDQPPR